MADRTPITTLIGLSGDPIDLRSCLLHGIYADVGKPHHAYTPCRHRPDNQSDLYSRSPALSPAVSVAPTTLRMIDSVAALAELDDAGLARLITAALKEGQRRLTQALEQAR